MQAIKELYADKVRLFLYETSYRWSYIWSLDSFLMLVILRGFLGIDRIMVCGCSTNKYTKYII